MHRRGVRSLLALATGCLLGAPAAADALTILQATAALATANDQFVFSSTSLVAQFDQTFGILSQVDVAIYNASLSGNASVHLPSSSLGGSTHIDGLFRVTGPAGILSIISGSTATATVGAGGGSASEALVVTSPLSPAHYVFTSAGDLAPFIGTGIALFYGSGSFTPYDVCVETNGCAGGFSHTISGFAAIDVTYVFSPVPEPASVAILAAGCAGLLPLRARRAGTRGKSL
ncbi:MAG: hypothetical protein JSS43_34210 [Proteobacteria bacterium]|nr:hypothetical protein [Pseudomonadota bacterium]